MEAWPLPAGWAARRFLRLWRLLRCANRPPLEGSPQVAGCRRGIGCVADSPHYNDSSRPGCHHLVHVTPVDATDREPGPLAADPLRGVAHVAEPRGGAGRPG